MQTLKYIRSFRRGDNSVGRVYQRPDGKEICFEMFVTSSGVWTCAGEDRNSIYLSTDFPRITWQDIAKTMGYEIKEG